MKSTKQKIGEVILPVLVRTRQNSKLVSIYSPDLHTTVHGRDYVSAWSDAEVKFGAIYFFALERNVKYTVHKDLAEVDRLCKNSGDFPTFMTLVSS